MGREKSTVPVSEKALIGRINRKLQADGEALKRTRGRYATELGDYYVVDLQRNCITLKDVDLEDYGREIGVLQPFESLRMEKAS